MKAFIAARYALVEQCESSNLHDNMLRDWIIIGIWDSNLSEKLQLDPELILDKAVTRVCQAEAVKQQQPLLHGKPDAPVGAVKKGKGMFSWSNKPKSSGSTNRKQE